MATHLPRGARAEVYQKPAYLPRFRDGVAGAVRPDRRAHARRRLLARQPDAIVTSSASRKSITHIWTADWRETRQPADRRSRPRSSSSARSRPASCRIASAPCSASEPRLLRNRITSVAPEITIYVRQRVMSCTPLSLSRAPPACIAVRRRSAACRTSAARRRRRRRSPVSERYRITHSERRLVHAIVRCADCGLVTLPLHVRAAGSLRGRRRPVLPRAGAAAHRQCAPPARSRARRRSAARDRLRLRLSAGRGARARLRRAGRRDVGLGLGSTRATTYGLDVQDRHASKRRTCRRRASTSW